MLVTLYYIRLYNEQRYRKKEYNSIFNTNSLHRDVLLKKSFKCQLSAREISLFFPVLLKNDQLTLDHNFCKKSCGSLDLAKDDIADMQAVVGPKGKLHCGIEPSYDGANDIRNLQQPCRHTASV